MTPILFKEKVNKVILLILFLFIGLGFRCLQLSVIHQESFIELAKKHRRKVVIEPGERGQILDCHGHILATDRVSYRAGISYDAIRKIPRTRYRVIQGKLTKTHPRSDYIRQLCNYLSKELSLDPLDIEDLIHGHASLFPHQFFPLKEDISDDLYSRLKAKEKDWPGLELSTVSKRTYPEKKLGCHVVGYMGAIHRQEYEQIQKEIFQLKNCLESLERGQPLPLWAPYSSYQEVQERLVQLQDKAYQANSLVGKAGIEGKFDARLRGTSAKKKLEVDTMGRTRWPLCDSTESLPGDTLYLSIDARLQRAAEILLAQHEEKRDLSFRIHGKNHHTVPAPWIKGGAVVAIDPQTGQVLALASYPQFDPNDFINRSPHGFHDQSKWLELPQHAAKIFEGELPLEKDYYSQTTQSFYTVSKKLTFETFLDMTLSTSSKVKRQLQSVNSIKKGGQLLHAASQVTELLEGAPPAFWIDILYSEAQLLKSGQALIDATSKSYYIDLYTQHQAMIEGFKEILHPFLSSIPSNHDKLLFLDLLRLFTPDNPQIIQSLELSIAEWFELNQLLIKFEKELKIKMKEWFHTSTFRTWRHDHFKTYLSIKRKEEKKEKRKQKPYLFYLQEEEKIQFDEFYRQFSDRFLFCLIDPLTPCPEPHYSEYLHQFRQTLQESLSHAGLKRLVGALRSDPSDEKIACAKLHKKVDDLQQHLFGIYYFSGKKLETLCDLALQFYPKTGFGYSRSYAYQEAAPQGSIFKIITAYEALRQQYEKNPLHQQELNPLTLTDLSDGKITDEQAQVLGYLPDGKKIQRFYKGGKLPRSSKRCGKIGIKDALEMSSNLYFSILSTDAIRHPTDLTRAAKLFGFGSKTGIDLKGEIAGGVPYDVLSNRTGLYALSIGQHSLVVTPLQTARMLSAVVNGGFLLKPEILHSKVRKIPTLQETPPLIQSYEALSGLDLSCFFFTQHAAIMESKSHFEREVAKKIFFPPAIRSILHEGLRRVINGDRGTARAQAIPFTSLEHKERYANAAQEMVGKTASAEIVYQPCLDKESSAILCKHIWFASSGFDLKAASSPPHANIVIITYLRYGDYGKEAAKLAVDLYREWKKIHEESAI